jgi:HK97 family phage major capsid protein
MPVIPAVQNAVGGVLYANFSYYAVADGVGGLAIDFSEHYKFTNNQGTWRFTENVDGQPWLKNTITLADGSTTVSPFVSTKGPA